MSEPTQPYGLVPLNGTGDAYLAPAMGLDQFHQQLKELKKFIEQNLRPDIDYGRIPGCPKPTLLKPGAEKMLRFYGLVVDGHHLPSSKLDVLGGVIDVDMEGVVRSTRSGLELGTVHANCNSEESRYYNARHPDEGKSTHPQRLGDQKNTIEKMADKRLWVAAALLYTLASEIFTQDIEDSPPPAEGHTSPTTEAPSVGGDCPSCHKGHLVERKRRDGSGVFWACDAGKYDPASKKRTGCQHIQNDPPLSRAGSSEPVGEPPEPPATDDQAQRIDLLNSTLAFVAANLKLTPKGFWTDFSAWLGRFAGGPEDDWTYPQLFTYLEKKEAEVKAKEK